MKSSDLKNSVDLMGIDKFKVCQAITVLLPVLHDARERATGWKFWLRWGMSTLIGALEAYRKEAC